MMHNTYSFGSSKISIVISKRLEICFEYMEYCILKSVVDSGISYARLGTTAAFVSVYQCMTFLS